MALFDGRKPVANAEMKFSSNSPSSSSSSDDDDLTFSQFLSSLLLLMLFPSVVCSLPDMETCFPALFIVL